MAAPTRTDLETWKRPALQQKCKELGIKANGKTELLIELLSNHYESQEGVQSSSSKPTTSTKRKAPAAASKSRPTADEDPAESSDDEQIASADAAASATQRQLSTRRKAAQNPAGPPPTKIRRVGAKSKVKAEPSEPSGIVDRVVGQRSAHASPRRPQIMEVVLASPAVAGKGKAKAREAPPKDGRTEDESDVEESGEASGPSHVTKARASVSSAPLLAQRTATTEIDAAPPNDVSFHSSVDSDQTRIADLELQVRNARKFNDEVARDVSNLKSAQQALRQALGDTEPSNITENLAPLGKLRDIAPQLISAAGLVDTIMSRVESSQRRAEELEASVQQDRSAIAELKERVRELEEGKSAVGDLEALVRQLQSQINMLPAALSQNNPIEDSGTERIYTIIRAPSHENSALASSSQRPSSRLSAAPEDTLWPPMNQDQNQGRSTSVSRGPRATRPPLAEKEGARVGQPDVEVETADPRRSIRRLAESLPGSSAASAPPSRARSTTPSQREPLSANPTPSRGKGKGRMNKRTASALDTVEEDGDVDVFQGEPIRSSTPVAPSPALPEQQPIETLGVDAAPAPSVSEVDEEIQHLPSPPPAPNPFSPTIEAPRSPARFFDAGRRESSGSPPSSASKPSSKSQQQGSSPSRGPPTHSDAGPIAQLPFKLIASPAKPQDSAAPSTSRAPAPTGRVPKAPRNSHLPYSRRPGGSRATTSESVNDAPTTATGMFNFALPETLSAFPSTTTTVSSAPKSPRPSNSLIDNPAGFITPERLESNFSLFPPTRFDFGQTPGGLAFKTTGRAPPGTPAVTTTLFGTEVARDTRFADLPYDPEAGRASSSWEEVPLWPGAAPRNTTN